MVLAPRNTLTIIRHQGDIFQNYEMVIVREGGGGVFLGQGNFREHPNEILQGISGSGIIYGVGQ